MAYTARHLRGVPENRLIQNGMKLLFNRGKKIISKRILMLPIAGIFFQFVSFNLDKLMVCKTHQEPFQILTIAVVIIVI